VVPGRAWSHFFTVEGNVAAYGVLGPFAGVDYVRFLYLAGSQSTDIDVRFAAAYGPSREETAVALRSGTSIVNRSQADEFDGQPCAEFYSLAGVPWNAQIPCGFRGGTGSQYLTVGVRSSDTEGWLRLLVSAEVWRIERFPGRVAGD
jgi:hypothetical protein